jgi:hypothetical protein
MATIYYPGGCPVTDGGYLNDCCPGKELARIRHVWYQKPAFNFSNILDPGEWTSAILNGDVIVVLNVRGSSDGGTWTEEDGFGNKPTTITAFEEIITYTDQNFLFGNVANYNAFVRGDWKIGYCTETMGFLFDESASIKPTKPVSEDIKAAVYGVIEVKIVQDEMPIPFVYPEEIFEECFQVVE